MLKAGTLALEVRLYGKLRRYAPVRRVDADSIVYVDFRPGETIGQVLGRLGIRPEEVSHTFLDGTLSALGRPVTDGSRLGVFPDDMALLYSWYFKKVET